jgi:hypothetical protein
MGDEPGYWYEDQRGRRYWHGPRFWTAAIGPSIIEYVTDRPVAALGCLLRDGSRGTIIYAIQQEDGLEPQWLRPRADGSVQSGRIEITAAGICFVDAQPRGYVSSLYRLSGEPGRYIASDRGGHKWQGPCNWVEMHGHAVIEIVFDHKSAVRGCLLPDGARGSVVSKEPVRELRDGEWVEIEHRWRRPMSDGSWSDGDIEIGESDIRFIDDPPRAPRQLDTRSPDDTPDLETDLMASARIADLVKDIRFATDLYRAMCNTDWFRNGVQWATTWRVAGGIVAYLRDLNEDYNDFYCSGDEGIVADDVAAELAALGWNEAPYNYP